jgi:hypothetical protein
MSGIGTYRGDWPHGNRARYVSGCRCEDCRRANREYAHTRALAVIRGDANPLVDASQARAHLLTLSKAGVGKRAVAEASDVALSVLTAVRVGAKQRIRARTERRILAVDVGARADGALVSDRETAAAIRELLSLGLTKTAIAAALGSEAKVPALQIAKRYVMAKTALKVQRLLAATLEAQLCPHCDLPHARRLEQLRACDEVELAELPTTWSCLYGGVKGAELLRADLVVLGHTLEVVAGPEPRSVDGKLLDRKRRRAA